MRLLRTAVVLGVALASPALAQTVTPGPAAVPDADRPAREASTSLPCTDCPGRDASRRSSSNTIVTTPEGKTIVPRALIREQSDFRLNEALRNVPGIQRR